MSRGMTGWRGLVGVGLFLGLGGCSLLVDSRLQSAEAEADGGDVSPDGGGDAGTDGGGGCVGPRMNQCGDGQRLCGTSPEGERLVQFAEQLGFADIELLPPVSARLLAGGVTTSDWQIRSVEAVGGTAPKFVAVFATLENPSGWAVSLRRDNRRVRVEQLPFPPGCMPGPGSLCDVYDVTAVGPEEADASVPYPVVGLVMKVDANESILTGWGPGGSADVLGRFSPALLSVSAVSRAAIGTGPFPLGSPESSSVFRWTEHQASLPADWTAWRQVSLASSQVAVEELLLSDCGLAVLQEEFEMDGTPRGPRLIFRQLSDDDTSRCAGRHGTESSYRFESTGGAFLNGLDLRAFPEAPQWYALAFGGGSDGGAEARLEVLECSSDSSCQEDKAIDLDLWSDASVQVSWHGPDAIALGLTSIGDDTYGAVVAVVDTDGRVHLTPVTENDAGALVQGPVLRFDVEARPSGMASQIALWMAPEPGDDGTLPVVVAHMREGRGGQPAVHLEGVRLCETP